VRVSKAEVDAESAAALGCDSGIPEFEIRHQWLVRVSRDE
jgi:hypothetical protein